MFYTFGKVFANAVLRLTFLVVSAHLRGKNLGKGGEWKQSPQRRGPHPLRGRGEF